VKETTSEDRQPLMDDKRIEYEAERLSSEALAEAIREILATSLPDHIPSAGIKSEPTLSTIPLEAEEKIEPISDQSTTVGKIDEEERSTTNEEPVLRVTTTTTTVVEEPSYEQQAPSHEVKEDSEAVEKVPTNSLTEIAGEILATPLSVRLSSAEPTTEQTTLVEQELEKPSTSIFGDIIQQIKDVYNDLTSTSEDSSIQKITPEEPEHEIR
jgi:hypothetical protein